MAMQKTAPSEPWKARDKTPVQKKTLNPIWNHCMVFPVALDSAQAVVAPDKVLAIMYSFSTMSAFSSNLKSLLCRYDWNQFSDPEFMGQISFAISSVPETPVSQFFDVKQHSMKKPQDKSLGSLQLVMMRLLFWILLDQCGRLEMLFSGTIPETILHPDQTFLVL
jgi:hypothetical protein